MPRYLFDVVDRRLRGTTLPGLLYCPNDTPRTQPGLGALAGGAEMKFVNDGLFPTAVPSRHRRSRQTRGDL
jgi:hypothetical protein